MAKKKPASKTLKYNGPVIPNTRISLDGKYYEVIDKKTVIDSAGNKLSIK